MDKYVESFTVSVEGERTFEQFRGEFTVKTLLSHRDQLEQDRVRRELLGQGVDRTISMDDPAYRAVTAAEIFSQLSVRIIKAPSWWLDSQGGMSLFDDAPIGEVYKRAMKAEKDQLTALKKKADEAKQELQTPITQPGA